MTMMTPELAGILLYTLLQLLLGFAVYRLIRTETDYLLAGRKLGYVLVTFSVFATWFGAESCIGTAGAAYAEGLTGVRADPFGYGLCVLIMGSLFAVRFWKMKLVTVADFFRVRYSPAAERLTAALMVPTSLLWAAAQIRAFALVLSSASDLTISIAMVVATAVVVIYTVFGGMLADAVTDVVQGVVLVAGLVILLVAVVNIHGDWGTFTGALRERLAASPAAAETMGRGSVLSTLETWSIPICGSLFAQELVSRVLAARSPTISRRSTLVAGTGYIAVGLIPVTLGLVGAGLLPGLEHREQILPALAHQALPGVLYIVFAGALLSAILSTVDSALLAVSGLLAHNVILPLRPAMTERGKVLLERSGVAAAGLIAAMVGASAEGVYSLVKDASAFGSAGIFVVVMAGMFSRIGGPAAALASLSTGAAAWIAGHYVLRLDHPYLVSLASSAAAYLLASIPRGSCSVNLRPIDGHDL